MSLVMLELWALQMVLAEAAAGSTAKPHTSAARRAAASSTAPPLGRLSLVVRCGRRSACMLCSIPLVVCQASHAGWLPLPMACSVVAAAEMVGEILSSAPVSYTHLRAHETDSYLVCRLLLE